MGRKMRTMNKISVIVDGNVILEHTCEKVQRDTEGVGVAVFG